MSTTPTSTATSTSTTTTAMHITCQCDDLFTHSISSACGQFPGTPGNASYFVQNGTCVPACDTLYYEAPTQSLRCKARMWCRVRNCAQYRADDCSVCLLCAANYEMGFFAAGRVCVTLEYPHLTCPSIILNLPAGLSTMNIVYNQIQATDNVALAGPPSCIKPSGTAFGVGAHNVLCKVSDVNGLETTCNFNVIVMDVTPPTMTYHTTPYLVLVDAGAPGATVVWDKPTATDAVDGPRLVTCDRDVSNTTFPLGTTLIHCTSVDASLNEAHCVLRVQVGSAPAVTCPKNMQVTLPALSMTVQVVYAATATHPDGIASVRCSPRSSSSFGFGRTLVTCTAFSLANIAASCAFIVEVFDVTPPLLVGCPSSITQNTQPGQSTAVAEWYPVEARDNAGLAGDPVCWPPSGSTFLLGQTIVTCSVGDLAGNTASCNFTVHVPDLESPWLSCPSSLNLTMPAAAATMPVTWSIASTDNAGSPTTVCTPSSGEQLRAGNHRVTCVATDAAGNIGMCTFNITVIGNLTCPPPVTQPTDPNAATAGVTFAVPASFQGDVTCTPASGARFPIGTTSVTCTQHREAKEIEAVDEENAATVVSLRVNKI